MPGAVTIATNMAGRGTDIQLGGNADYRLQGLDRRGDAGGTRADEAQIDKQRERLLTDVAEKKRVAIEAGGLYVIGTERHESRRIDNQLRGRSGRQGDPGRSKFYLSLEDDLMRIFGSERMDSVLKTLGLQEGEAITHPWMNKSLEMAQKKVEARNFDIRKQILKYDDVMNDQRKVIFEQRLDIMAEEDVSETITDLRHQLVHELVHTHIPEKAYAEQWNTKGLQDAVAGIFGVDLPIDEWARRGGHRRPGDRGAPHQGGRRQGRAEGSASSRPENFRQIEKMVLLQTLDHLWREHLVTLEHLRQVIGFRAYGQRDPLNEYKSEAFVLFEAMLAQPARGGDRPAHARRAGAAGRAAGAAAGRAAGDGGASHRPDLGPRRVGAGRRRDRSRRPRRHAVAERRPPLQTRKKGDAVDPGDPATWGRSARNALCPCGSGKKYKHCHGKRD